MPHFFIYLDALGYEYVNDKLMPFLSKLKKDSSFYFLKNVMGYSFAIQSTMLSGKLPSETLHWMPYIYISEKHALPLFKILHQVARFYPFECEPYGLKLLRHFILSLFLGKRAKICNIPPKWANKFYIYPYYYMDKLPFYKSLKRKFSEKGIRMIYYGPPSCKYPLDKIIDILTKNTCASPQFGANDLIVVYVDELDAIGHTYGPNSHQWFNKLYIIDRKLKSLYALLEKSGQLYTLLIFSDHGCCEVAATIDILSFLKKMHLDNEVIAFVDATLAMLWFEKETCKLQVLEKLSTFLRNKAKIFDVDNDKNILSKYGIAFTQRVYGDLIIQLEPKLSFFPNFYSGLAPFKGAHGYMPESKYQRTFLLYHSNTLSNSEVTASHISDIKTLLLSLCQKK